MFPGKGRLSDRVCCSDLHVISQSETFLRLHARLRDPARVRVYYNGARYVTLEGTHARETELVRQSKSELHRSWLMDRRSGWLRSRLYPRASRTLAARYSISETIKAALKDANI